MAHYPDVTTKGCFYYGYATYAAVPTGTLLRANWTRKSLGTPLFRGQRGGQRAHRRSVIRDRRRSLSTVPISGVRAAVKQKLSAMRSSR